MEVIQKGKQRYIALLMYQLLLARNVSWENGNIVKNMFGQNVKQFDKRYESYSKDLNVNIKGPKWKDSYYYKLIKDYETSPILFQAHNDLLSIIAGDILPTDIVSMDARVYSDICKFHKYGSMSREEFVEYANKSTE
jgi:hypothetical protein